MEFSIEAIRGIVEALPELEREGLQREAVKYGIFDLPKNSEERRRVAQQILIDFGYIMPFETGSLIDHGAEEYEEIMSAQEVMEGE